MGKKWKQGQILFSWAPKSLRMVTTARKLKKLALWKKCSDKPRQHIKKQRHHFAGKSLRSQSYGFSSCHVWMWELDYKEGWALKNRCFRTALEKTLESPLDSKEIKRVNPEGNQLWIFIGRTDAEAEAPILWRPAAKSWLGKRPWCWKRLRVRWEGGDRGWYGWMASYFGHLLQRADLEKTLMLEKMEGMMRRGRQRMRWLDGITHQLNGHESEQTPGR